MDFRILGPLEASDEGRDVALGGSKQRALLTLLLVNANETLSTDRLIDELWGESPPATAPKTVQVYVHRLRRTLAGEGGHSDLLVTREHGYELRVDPEQIDARRFERMLGEGSAELAAGDPAAAAETLEAALALWRGEPLAGLAYEPFARAEVERLEDLRVTAVERLVEAKLELGRHLEVVGELEALIAEHPFRESLRAQLMLALYRGERQADALQAYQNARATLVEELGIEPGERLRELERAILAQDPALALPVTVPDEAPREAPVEPAVQETPREQPARKLVSIVFADLVGSTGLAERLDPEAMHMLLDRYTARCEAVVERHGGRVEGFIGDAVVGVFGQDEIHEDDALRAVRAAVDLREAGAELSAELERELGVAIGMKLGVESGEVFVSRGARRSPFAAGDAFNVAARLEGLAAEGQILLGEKVHELVAAHVQAEPLEPLALKGRRAKVQAWRLVELGEGRADAGPSPLVGRERELAELRAAFEDVRADGGCRAITLIGPAGIGKSRLARELESALEGEAVVAVGRCLSYGDDIAYRPFAEMVYQLCGADPRRRVEELLDGDTARARLVLQAIGLAEGAAKPEETSWALRTLLERAAGELPLVVMVDDVHWAEPALLDLLDYLLAFSTGSPILLLCLARPELGESRPAWMVPQPDRDVLVLDALSSDQARRLVEPAGLDPDAEARIVGLAEGNPLFLEQLMAMGVEAGGSTLPSTIQAVLAARIDRLDDPERRALEHAAVQGRSFWVDAVAELLPEEEREGFSTRLVALVGKQLIRPDRSEAQGRNAFRFAHALIREVAYGGLPKVRRAELHERLARWLETARGARDETIGFHLSESYDLRAELGPVGDHELGLAQAAAERLGSAAAAARLRGDTAAGARLLARADGLLDRDDAGRSALRPVLGAALFEAGRPTDAARVLDAAIERAPDSGSRACAQVERELVRFETEPAAAASGAGRVADDALRVLEDAGDHRGQCRALLLRGEVDWWEGQAGDAEVAWAQASACASRAGDERELFEVLGWRAVAAALGPAPVPEAIRRCEDFRKQVEGSPIATASTLNPLALLNAMAGDLEAADALLAEASGILAEVGGLGAGISHLEASVRLLGGRPELAEATLRADLETLASMNVPGTLATTTALLAQAVLAQGRALEAGELAQEAARGVAQDDTITEVIWRGVAARTAARAGRADEAETLAREAVALATPTDLLSHRGDAMLDLADVLWLAGRPEEGEQSAREGLALYETKGNVAAAARARALLDAQGGG